jgi:MFS family permease
LNGSTIAFLAVYASRLGADPVQIGMLNAVPAIIALVVALPAGQWLGKRPIGKAVFLSSVFNRFFYLFLVFLPLGLSPQTQVWAILLITLVMGVPGTALLVGFNALFAEAVPSEYRGHVAGIRNALIAFVSVVTTLICGQILIRIPFPICYQIVFGIGFLGAAMSSYHLGRVRPARHSHEPERDLRNLPASSQAEPPEPAPILRGTSRLGLWAQRLGLGPIDIIRGPYGRIVLLLFAFHLAQYLGIPVFPLYLVNELKISDQTISIGTAIFNGLVFIGSMQLARLTIRLGNKRVTGLGVVFLSLYPGLMSIFRTEGGYLLASAVGGLAWSMVGGAIYNYLLEKVPGDRRPAYLAWYNMALNAAILIGSLSGPAMVNLFGFGFALTACAIARFLAGIAILRWG